MTVSRTSANRQPFSFPRWISPKVQIESHIPMTPHGGDGHNEGDTILGGTEASPPMVDGTDGHVE